MDPVQFTVFLESRCFHTSICVLLPVCVSALSCTLVCPFRVCFCSWVLSGVFAWVVCFVCLLALSIRHICPNCYDVHLRCPWKCLSICPSVRLSVGRSVCLSACLSVCLSICLSACLYVYPFVCPSVCLRSVYPSICLYVRVLSVSPSASPSVC